MEYFISINGTTLGPMSAQMVMTHPVTPDTYVCTVSDYTWKPLSSFPELAGLMEAHTPGPANLYASGKDRVVAGVLAILLGTFGAQYFYIGKPLAAIITIVLCLVSCGIWNLLMLAQGIYMLTLTPEEFDRKYPLSPSTYPLF